MDMLSYLLRRLDRLLSGARLRLRFVINAFLILLLRMLTKVVLLLSGKVYKDSCLLHNWMRRIILV